LLNKTASIQTDIIVFSFSISLIYLITILLDSISSQNSIMLSGWAPDIIIKLGGEQS
jgi:hypothetical protein